MPDPNASNLLLFFGRLHPLLVHLPIGFLAILAVLELANRVRHFKHAAQARSVVLFLTVVASVVAVVCGLMLASAGGYDPALLFWHKWMGIALAIACMLTGVSFWGKRHRLYVGFLMITLLLLGPASHFGGSMTHGKDYLIAYAPSWMRSWFGKPPAPQAPKRVITDPQQAVVFGDLIQPMLAQSCTACHNADKFKGQLRLDSFDAIMKGGATGPALAAGKASESLLIQRLLLPSDDPKHMPPTGTAQLTDDQLMLLRWWIDSGAAADKTVAQLDPPLKIADAAAAAIGIAPATQPAPEPIESLRPQIAQLETKLGVIVETVASEEPWLAINTSMAKTFGDAELAQLAPLSRNITSLNLAGAAVTDAGLATVADMPSLRRLRLERTAITDAGLQHLAGLRKLEYLNLYATPVSGAGLKPLTGLPSLRHVYLWRTKVEPEAAKAFAEAMVDPVKVRRWQEQIDALQARIDDASIEVVHGIAPATAPAPAPATAPTTAVAAAPTTVPATTPLTAPATAPASAVAVNTVCPVSGKPIDPAHVIDFESKRVAFCCGNCPAEFQKDPAKYRDKLKLTAAE